AAFHRTAVGAGLWTPALLPLECFGAATDAFLEAVVRVGYLVAGFAGHILQDEIDGIHLQLVRDVVHHRFNPVEALRIFGTAEISGDGLVRVNGIDHALDVRTLIDVDAANRARVLAITTHAAVAAKLDGFEQTIARHTNLVILNRRPASMNADEI